MFRSLMASAAALVLSSGLALAKSDIIIGMQLEPPNLDPTSGAAAAIDEVVYANLFEGLTRYRADGSIAPALAESWTISPDGLTYTFKLHEGVVFHDGTAFDAADVVFTMKRAMAEDSTNAQKQLFAGIEAVSAAEGDPYKVVFKLKAPNGGFLTNLAWGDAVILSDETLADAAYPGTATKPVGTGPFRLGSWAPGDSITLVENPVYWGKKPALTQVTFKFISDPTAAFAAMMAGDIDAFPVFPSPETLSQFASDPRFSVVVGSTEGETILAMNNKGAATSDPKVREAIAHAINRQEIIDGAMFGYGTPIGSHFPPHSPDYIDLTGLSNYDPDRAKALLAEAGHAEGLTLTLKLPPPAYARRGGEIIAAQLRAVGIETEITNLEWAQWLEQVFKGKDFDLTIVSHTEPNDINIYARPDYYFQYDNPTFQGLMQALNNSSDPGIRHAILGAAQVVIAVDHVNGFLFQLARTGVANAKIKGLWANSPTQANDMTGVSWQE